MVIIGGVIAGLIAVALTALDLDKTFYIPKSTPDKARLWSWWWTFCILNGLMAAGIYSYVVTTQASSVGPLLLGFMSGLAYLALARLKLTTIQVNDSAIPVGIETLYNSAREAVYRRIDTIAQEARYSETSSLAANSTVAELATKAFYRIESSAVTSISDKEASRTWLALVLEDKIDRDVKKLILANYLLSGSQTAAPTIALDG